MSIYHHSLKSESLNTYHLLFLIKHPTCGASGIILSALDEYQTSEMLPEQAFNQSLRPNSTLTNKNTHTLVPGQASDTAVKTPLGIPTSKCLSSHSRSTFNSSSRLVHTPRKQQVIAPVVEFLPST